MISSNLRYMDPSKFIIRGVNFELTDSLYRAALDKVGRLMRENEQVGRIAIDLEIDHTTGPADRFVAKGRLEVGGPALLASAHSENTYKALDLLMETLDALLRVRRALRPKETAHAGDLKAAM
jgi:putative sigma-54 modulation protein